MPLTNLKAAEILTLNIKEAGPKTPPDVRDALIRAKECLESREYHRNAGHLYFQDLLPSESRDRQ